MCRQETSAHREGWAKPVRFAAPLIFEETLEAACRDALGDNYERGSAPRPALFVAGWSRT